jgi:hypothetical protein
LARFKRNLFLRPRAKNAARISDGKSMVVIFSGVEAGVWGAAGG